MHKRYRNVFEIDVSFIYDILNTVRYVYYVK